MTNEEIAADIISLIRRYAIGSVLISHEARIRKAIEKLVKAHKFSKQEMNWIKRMETYLSEFKEIKQFQTSVESARRASIHIYFTKEHQKSGFPYTLKANMINKALQLGGGDWSIYGLQDQGFSNNVRESAGSFRVKMYGYNYDELYDRAEQLKEKFLSHRRIKEVTILSLIHI